MKLIFAVFKLVQHIFLETQESYEIKVQQTNKNMFFFLLNIKKGTRTFPSVQMCILNVGSLNCLW